MEKIQTANHQLFATSDIESLPSVKHNLQPGHRVTFSSDIEEYDHTASVTDDETVSYKDDTELDNEIAEIIERDECAANATEIDAIDGSMRNISIDELCSNGNRLNGDNTAKCRRALMANSIYSAGRTKRNRPTSANPFKHRRPSRPIDAIFNIHLNIKSCCQHKCMDSGRLPRYNGYVSQYGMSKDQLEWREMNRQQSRLSRMRHQRQIMNAKQEISELNEQAFRQWLIRKDRGAKPKYKNMYDL